MAKTPSSKNTTVATVSAGGHVPSYLAKRMQESEGRRGTSQRAEDNIVPLVYLLQALSPQVNRKKPEYIEGAAAGDILLRNNSARPIVPGDEGCVVVPVHFSVNWLEWRPNRGGFVARHPEALDRPGVCPVPGAKMVDAKNDRGEDILVMRSPQGNDLIQTREHVVLIDGQPYVIPFSGTKHTASRTWMSRINQKQHGNKIVDSFSCAYILKTIAKSNQKGDYFVYDVDDLPDLNPDDGDYDWRKGETRWVDELTYQKAEALYNAFNTGEKQAETSQPDRVADEDMEWYEAEQRQAARKGGRRNAAGI